MVREKRTFSGPLCEVDIYPVTNTGRKLPTRSPKTKISTEQQKKYNQLQATKKFIRLANANFGNEDYLMHPTYLPEKAPQSEKEARRDIVNYLRRVKARRESKLNELRKRLTEITETEKLIKISSGPKESKLLKKSSYLHDEAKMLKKQIKNLKKAFKYIYVIERQTYKSGKFAGRDNWHFHLFVTGGLARSDLEGMWPSGIRVNCNVYQPERFGPEAAARYMSKDPQGSKRFSHSKNLTQPKEKIRDDKISGNTVERVAKLYQDDAEYWERRYKGYKFLRCYSRLNPYNLHWYISVIMYKTDSAPPKWDEPEWITTDFENERSNEWKTKKLLS